MAATPAEALGGKLSESWAATILTPAFLFWAGGLAGAIWARAGLAGWKAVVDSLSRQPSATQIALLAVGLIVVTVSGFVVQSVTLPFTRGLEGYWPEWFGLREHLSRCRGPSKADDDRWQTLAGLVESGKASDRQVREFIVLDLQLRRIPNEPALFSWWAAPVGLVVAYLAYRRAAQVAEVYGDLVEAAFDVHRGALYDALRWPRPAGPDREPAVGAQLIGYLRRGTAPPQLEFTGDSSERETRPLDGLGEP